MAVKEKDWLAIRAGASLRLVLKWCCMCVGTCELEIQQLVGEGKGVFGNLGEGKLEAGT